MGFFVVGDYYPVGCLGALLSGCLCGLFLLMWGLELRLIVFLCCCGLIIHCVGYDRNVILFLWCVVWFCIRRCNFFGVVL